MNRRILAACVAAATLFSAHVASAQFHPGVNLNWGACYGDGPVTGLGSCAGCGTPVCLMLNSLRITTEVVNGHPIDDEVLTGGAAAPNSNFITWLGGGSPSTNLGTRCPAATPAHDATWGAVKAMYR